MHVLCGNADQPPNNRNLETCSVGGAAPCISSWSAPNIVKTHRYPT